MARLSTLDPRRVARQRSTSTSSREGAELAQRGFAPEAMRFRHALDMRYVRQAFELTVDLPEGVRERRGCARSFSTRTRATSGAPTRRRRSRS